MKTVLFIISSFGEGGAQRVIANLANHFCVRYDVSILVLWDSGFAYDLDRRVKTACFPEDRSANRFPGKLPMLSRLLWCLSMKKRIRPDVSISFLPAANLVNVLSRGKDRCIVSERSDPSALDLKHLLAEKFAFRIADRVVFQSEYVRRQFSVPIQNKSCTIGNPVNVPFPASEERSNRIVNVGRLVPQKNQKLLIDAFSDFRKIRPDYDLDIFGTGELEAELREKIERSGLEHTVNLRGFVPDVYSQIKQAKMFVLSSDYEGLSNSLIEAMMMGIACISTKTAGSAEVIESMKNGILVDIGDREALTAAMLRIAEDDDLRKKLEKEAANTGKQFRTDMIAARWEELL